MNDYQTLTTNRLRALLDETEATMADLKTELDRREQVQQEHEVANLENHMQSAEISLRTIRDFLAFLSNDMKSVKNNEK